MIIIIIIILESVRGVGDGPQQDPQQQFPDL